MSQGQNPESYLDHQDWKTLIVKKQKTKKEIVHKQNTDPNHKMEKQIENGNTKHKKIDENFRKSFQDWRSSQKMTQKDVAQRLNVQSQIITQFENGQLKHNPQLVSKMKRLMAKK